jgi:hypothetical protein
MLKVIFQKIFFLKYYSGGNPCCGYFRYLHPKKRLHIFDCDKSVKRKTELGMIMQETT